MAKNQTKLFVYGTLRTHQPLWEHYLAPRVGILARVSGVKLLADKRAAYPYAVLGNRSNFIVGEVFMVSNKELEDIDAAEVGYSRVKVHTDSGVVVWMYVADIDRLFDLPVVEHGDWLKHHGEPLFVYGTLQFGWHNWRRFLAPQTAVEYKMPGVKLKQAWGTARMVASRNPNDYVLGELYWVTPSMLRKLDAHEGYSKDRKFGNVYDRREIDLRSECVISPDQGKFILPSDRGWTYFHAGRHKHLEAVGVQWTPELQKKYPRRYAERKSTRIPPRLHAQYDGDPEHVGSRLCPVCGNKCVYYRGDYRDYFVHSASAICTAPVGYYNNLED